MRKLSFVFMTFAMVAFFGCSEDEGSLPSTEIGSESFDSSSKDSGEPEGSNGNSSLPGGEAGLITAGEWNDLDNWGFWKDIIQKETYATSLDYWKFSPRHRVAVLLHHNNDPVINAKLELLKNERTIWTARTDNFGRAELWIDLLQPSSTVNMSDYKLAINGQESDVSLKLFEDGINEIAYNVPSNQLDRVELAFVVDATGSMGDELEFLKEDLKDVIEKVGDQNQSLDIYTSAVFYRDEGDDYVVRKSEFNGNLNKTIDFIKEQEADGGGDYPEAVHTALKTGIDALQWSENAKTRLVFLLLDAPPHYEIQALSDLQNSIKNAAEKGIKIIPVTASGIDKSTEFLMRFFAITTNGTYVFITNHSGIGNDHIEASVGEYQVEYLNALMTRLISKYTR